MAAFSHKFSIAPSCETTDRIKKLGGPKMVRTSYHRAKYCRRKSVIFCLSVMLSNYKFCDNGIKQCYFQRCHCVQEGLYLCTYIQLFYGPPEFPLRGKFIPKITIYRYFVGCKPTFLKPQRWNLAWGRGPGTPRPHAKFYKKSFKGVCPF